MRSFGDCIAGQGQSKYNGNGQNCEHLKGAQHRFLSYHEHDVIA